MSASANPIPRLLLTISQDFTTGEPIHEPILSDVVPSNIVSR